MVAETKAECLRKALHCSFVLNSNPNNISCIETMAASKKANLNTEEKKRKKKRKERKQRKKVKKEKKGKYRKESKATKTLCRLLFKRNSKRKSISL